MLSPSDIVVRPTNLTERLAAQPATHEPTPTTMAERFAPEGQKLLGDDPAELPAEPVIPGYIAERASARVSSAGQGLLIAAILISLIPTAAVLGSAVAGRDHDPRSQRRAEVHRSPDLQYKRSCRARAGASRPARASARAGRRSSLRRSPRPPFRKRSRSRSRRRARSRRSRARKSPSPSPSTPMEHCRREASSPFAPCPRAPPSRKAAPTAPPSGT